MLGHHKNWPAPKAAATNQTHKTRQSLLVAIDDAAACQIVRRKLDRDLVSRENTNKILAHLAGDVRQNLVLVLQFDAEHGVRQRLDDRGHDFNGVLFGISGVALVAFLFVFELLRHVLLLPIRAGLKPGLYKPKPQNGSDYPPLQHHHEGPVTPFGRVRIHGPLAVTATVCSKCAEGLPSAVSAVHSSRIRTSGRPALTIGSTAMTMPSCKRAPRPSSP